MNIALICTDFHLQVNNLSSVYEILDEALSVAESKGIRQHIWLGDIFDSRVSQRQEVLNVLTSIIELYDERGHHITCIGGNHDKVDYNSEASFLDEYKYHPSFDLITQADFREIQSIPCYFVPFFNEAKWLEEFNKFESIKKGSLLFSHIAVQGSINNDGTKVESSIKPGLFKSFKRVYLGHYHNSQEVGTNVFHLGSLQQNNFGEDPDKGFWLLKENGDVELIHSTCGQQYKKLIIDLDEIDHKKATSMIKKFKEGNPNCRLRVELTGESASVKAFDNTSFPGIDIKRKYKEVEEELPEEEVSEVEKASFDDIAKKFKKFCEENEYGYEEGFKILKKAYDGRN